MMGERALVNMHRGPVQRVFVAREQFPTLSTELADLKTSRTLVAWCTFLRQFLEPSHSQTSPHSAADRSRPMTSLSQACSPFLPHILYSVFCQHLEMHAQCVCHPSKVPGMLLVTWSSAFAFNQINQPPPVIYLLKDYYVL